MLSTRMKIKRQLVYFYRRYIFGRYPPGTPDGESTICQSWFFLARKVPAQDNR